jgi:hypothetical protein
MPQEMVWNVRQTPAALRPMFTELGQYYPLQRGPADGLQLAFQMNPESAGCEVRIGEGKALVKYSTTAQAARAVGALLSGLVSEKAPYIETTPFETLGIMLDCSRNAVMQVEHIEKWLRQLALLGYNMLMLYTEDTYALPGEPYFGYQRGAYSVRELRQIDHYAAKLGIEVVPCIQTLGHLEKILRHGAYRNVRDTASVMLVGEPETYVLIEKMIVHWKRVCRTNRIHIGMDETHDLGRGRYLDKHGYRNGFELFNAHLGKVVDICRKHELTPMIWSDMYFRLGNEKMGYYELDTVIPKSVVKKIPQAAQLVYWDYYHADKAFYLDWIARHRAMGKEPLVGSGIWTWNKYWYDKKLTEAHAGACIDACHESNIKELFFTMWGDNGAYCDHDSAFAGMVYCAEKAYGHSVPTDAKLEKRFAAICGGSYAAHLLASQLNVGGGLVAMGMWEDPIYESHFRTVHRDSPKRMADTAAGYTKLARKLRKYITSRETGDFAYAYATAKAFADRYTFAAELQTCYRKRDHQGLKRLQRRIGKVQASILLMEDAFRAMWMAHNKPEGLETMQARFGMLQARYRELERRLGEYLRGDISTIAEWEYACPPK